MSQKFPFFSIIIPTYNRPQRLADCLKSLSQLQYPSNSFEVVIVNDGSEISLEPTVKPFESVLNLSLINQSNAGPATARNTGAKLAKGQYLAFTDDDCQPASNWLTAFAEQFAEYPQALIGGQTLNALSNNLYSTASQQLIDYLYSYYNANATQARFVASNNFAVPAQLFHSLNGFDTTFPLAAGEDREFCSRWLHHQYQIIYSPQVQVFHAHELTFQSFCRQHFNYGRGAFCFHQTSIQTDTNHQKREPLTFYRNLLLYPFTQTSQPSVLFLAALFFVSQVANATGLFWEKLFHTQKTAERKTPTGEAGAEEKTARKSQN
jgi:glycosyltransferase involved in cell wall biosynthesis